MVGDNTDINYALSNMIENRISRRQGWDYVAVPSFPKLSTLQALTYIGSWSWTQPNERYKMLLNSVIYNYGAGIVTPSDMARDYITYKYGAKPLRCNKYQYQALVRKRKTQPLFALPQTIEYGYYVDMKSAYWQILQLGGWDVDYLPNGFLAVRSTVEDFPFPNHKLARNALVSIGLPSNTTIWKPNDGLITKKVNKNINLVLWGFVQDILHTFANEMIERAGAIYVNTDGYIIPEKGIREAFTIADEWGLLVSIREVGKATVRGVGDYDIGSHISGRKRNHKMAHKYIIPVNGEWLKSKVRYFSHRIKMDRVNTNLFDIQ